MEIEARDLMLTEYDTVSPEAPIGEAVRLMLHPEKGQKDRRIFGLLVVNESRELKGMVSLYDILFHLDRFFHEQPPAPDDSADRDDTDWEQKFKRVCSQAADLKVEDFMTREVVKVDENSHITDIIDLMVKTGFRRLPVCRGRSILGLIYISDVFYEIYKNLFD